jgi:hypothetical protein
MFIYIYIISYYKLFLYFISKCNIGQSLMFIYIHIISYYKLFLYFNMCLSVKSNSLLCSFTSFLTSIQGLPSSGFELYCSNYINVFVYFDFDLWNISIVKMGISYMNMEWYSHILHCFLMQVKWVCTIHYTVIRWLYGFLMCVSRSCILHC